MRFYFSLLLSLDISPPPKCCTCVCTLSRNDGYLRVLAAMSETCRATWPLHLFFSDFSSSLSRLFPANPKSEKEEKKSYWTCTPHIYIVYIRTGTSLYNIERRENWFPFNRLFIPQHRSGVRWFWHGSLVPRQMLCASFNLGAKRISLFYSAERERR